MSLKFGIERLSYHELFKFLAGDCRAKNIPLDLVATHSLKTTQVHIFLNPFSNHFNTQFLATHNQILDKLLPVTIGMQVIYHYLVELQCIDGQFRQIRKRRKASTEIINGQSDSE